MAAKLQYLLAEEQLDRHAVGAVHLGWQRCGPIRVTMISAQRCTGLRTAGFPCRPGMCRFKPQLFGEHTQIQRRMPDAQGHRVAECAGGQYLADVTRSHCPLPPFPSSLGEQGRITVPRGPVLTSACADTLD